MKNPKDKRYTSIHSIKTQFQIKMQETMIQENKVPLPSH